jgi:ABC-type xylose transport system permease subunit
MSRTDENNTDRSRDQVFFWCLLATQTLGSGVIIWVGLPIFQHLNSAESGGATPRVFAIALAAVAVMQAAYWPAHALKQRLHFRFRRNALWGHVLISMGEFSLFFMAALVTVALFAQFRGMQHPLWKSGLLVLGLFAVSCYKYQLMSLGEKLIDAKPDAAAES